MNTQAALAGPRDEALPALGVALDGQLMAGLFADVLRPAGHWAVTGCTLERIKYRPRRNCSLAYRLRLRHRSSGDEIVQSVAARLCSGDSARRAERAARSALPASPAGPAWHHLPALDMMTWWWPSDAKLMAPQALADETHVRTEMLPEVLSWLGGGRLLQHRLSIAQYVPEQRVCARFDIDWLQAGQVRDTTVYAKSSLEPDGAAAHAILRTLQDSAASREGRLHTPRALGWQLGSGLHWQSAAPGVAMLDLPTAQAAALAPVLGAQLAALHATPVTLARELNAEGLAQRLSEVCTVLAQALPQAARALAQAQHHLAKGLVHLPGHRMATLHGDLHPRNLLVDGDCLTLIDLDGMRRGAALLELGAWVADGIYRAHLDGADPLRDGDHWLQLLLAYADAGGERPGSAELAWSAAWNLLTQRAFRCVVNLKPGRWQVAPALVACAAELAAGGGL